MKRKQKIFFLSALFEKIIVVHCHKCQHYGCFVFSLFAREKATWGSGGGCNPPSGGSLPQIILETLELFTTTVEKAVTIDFHMWLLLRMERDQMTMPRTAASGQITHINFQNYRCRQIIILYTLQDFVKNSDIFFDVPKK